MSTRNLSGWQRLWVLLSLILVIPASALVIVFFPGPTDIEHQADFLERLSADAKAQVAAADDPSARKVRMPNGYVIGLRDGFELRKSVPALKEYNEIVSSELQRKRAMVLGLSFLSWVGLCVALYLIGWGIGWVRKGFRPDGSAP